MEATTNALTHSLSVRFVDDDYFLVRIREFEAKYQRDWGKFLGDYDKHRLEDNSDYDEWAFLCHHYMSVLVCDSPPVMVRQMKAIPIGNYDGWNRYDDDFQHKLHVWANGKSYDIEVPKYPDGAREAIIQSLDPVSQWDAGYEAGKVVGAASERARADAAERERDNYRFTAVDAKAERDNWYATANKDRLRAETAEAEVESLRSELREAREEIKRLILQYTVAECWWDDDTTVESPEEYADNYELKVGDTFELQAATYWGEEYRVTKVPDSSDDTYECEQISKQREEFETYQQMAAELRDMREALTRRQKRGHQDTCSNMLSAEYECDCGYVEAAALLSRKEDKAQ